MRRLLAALAVAIGLLLALSGPALAVAVGPKAINPTSDPFRTCTVGAAVSYDSGSTWQNAQSLHSDSQTGVPVPVPDANFQFFHDKESVTADPNVPGTAYVVWDVLIGPNMSVEADLHAAAFEDR